jgi:hypothetical protein
MPIEIEDIAIKIISPAKLTTNRRGETYTLIVAPLTNLRDHWYANFYPTSIDAEVDFLKEVQKGDIVKFCGYIRKYPKGDAFGVVIDIAIAWPVCDDDDEYHG